MSKKNKKKNKAFNNDNANNQLNNNQNNNQKNNKNQLNNNKQNNQNNNKNNNNNNFVKHDFNKNIDKTETNKNDVKPNNPNPINNNKNDEPKEVKSIFEDSFNNEENKLNQTQETTVNNKENNENEKPFFEEKMELEEQKENITKSIFEESITNEESDLKVSDFEEQVNNNENNQDELNPIFEDTINEEENSKYEKENDFEETNNIENEQPEKEFESYEESNNEKEVSNTDTPTAKKEPKRWYFGYYSRITVLILLLIITLGLAVVFAFNILDISKEDYLNYTEKSNIDYKVYLKENNFYDTDYLLKDRVYVASLIDKINVDFNYNFTSDKNVDALFKYNINAKLLITDINNENVYYEKEYVLLPEKEVSLNENRTKTIIETININYDQYNKVANNFKNNYALNTKNKLIIYFNVDKNFMNGGNIFNNDKNKISLEIPLSEKSVEIKLDTNEINKDNKLILSTKNEYKVNIYFVVLFVIAICAFIIVLLKVIKYIKCLKISDNCYDIYINKILSEYDRLIVKTNTAPFKNKSDKENIINVENFEELLDVRDNVKKPIMYYVITEHIKCQFYIKNEGNIYITTIKRVDLEAKNENI